MKSIFTSVVLLLFAFAGFSQLKADIIYDDIVVPSVNPMKSQVMLPSGNTLNFCQSENELRVVKLDQNFHIIGSHKLLLGNDLYFIKAERVGDRIYLLTEKGAYMHMGIYLSIVDTNGFINKTAYFSEIKPEYAIYERIEIFPLENNQIGIASNNGGGLELLKVPADLNIITPSIGSHVVLPAGYENGYNLLGFDVSKDGKWLAFTFAGVDSIVLNLIKFTFEPSLTFEFSRTWKLPYPANFSVEEAEPVSIVTIDETVVMVGFQNKMFMYADNPISIWPIIGSTLPENYSILSFDRNLQHGTVINVLNKDDGKFYIISQAQGSPDLYVYENGAIQKSILRNDTVFGYTRKSSIKSEVEKFNFADIAMCHNLVDEFELGVYDFHVGYESASLFNVNRSKQMIANPNWAPYDAQINYICDPNHLSVAENESIEIFVFPNPASESLHVELNGEISKITVFDLSGKIIRTESNAKKIIDTNDLKSGMYLLKIISDKGTFIKKFVVEH